MNASLPASQHPHNAPSAHPSHGEHTPASTHELRDVRRGSLH